MNKYLVALLLVGLGVVPAPAQDFAPPTRLQEGTLLWQIFKRYTETLRYQNLGFVPSQRGPMGIYLVTEYRNATGQDCYRIEICLDDRWKQHVPTRASYWNSNSEVVLFFEGNLQGQPQRRTTQPDELRCFERLVGDRVFLLPPVGRELWTSHPDSIRTGNWNESWRPTQTDYTGNPYGAAVFERQPDGTFSMLIES
jgi:hypothetical protein